MVFPGLGRGCSSRHGAHMKLPFSSSNGPLSRKICRPSALLMMHAVPVLTVSFSSESRSANPYLSGPDADLRGRVPVL